MKRIVILGSTGSIGINTLKVVARYPERFKVVGLSAYNNVDLLAQQIKRFSPRYVAIPHQGLDRLKGKVTSKVKFFDADGELELLVSLKEVDCVVIGMRGSAALRPFLKALEAGKTVAPANKEALVIAGDILMRKAKQHKAKIIPIDSEQSAIFQCIDGRDRNELKKIYLTASGGALLNVPQKRFDRLTVAEILAHPRWKMGRKITVDSATLMNKGFEVIEAKRLFNCPVKDIEVVIHPEAIIHSMVEWKDGSIIAQLGITDMRIPIQYALTYPERLDTGLAKMDFFKLGALTFKRPDFSKFPSLGLAIEVANKGGTYPSVLNAADEEAVDAFLGHKMSFNNIFKVVERIVERHQSKSDPSIADILAADSWARIEARKVMAKI